MVDTGSLLRRFLDYARIDTQSDPHSKSSPTTEKQWTLIRKLEAELREIGVDDVEVTDTGCVLGTLPATTSKANATKLVFLAHVDTATSCPGGAKPVVHRDYDGGPIRFADDPEQVLTAENTPGLAEKKGHDIVTASGGTLLGADDKAGIAIVMEAARILLARTDAPRGTVRVCFTPDEEVGRGADRIAVERLAADVGYTIDAQGVGAVDCETFSADRAVVRFHGVPAHPGWAKGVMVNALRLAADFVRSLPAEMSPERTEDREGFLHPDEVRGTAERAEVFLLLRDFEVDGLAAKRSLLEAEVARLREAEPRARIELEVTPQYRNMRYRLEKDARPVDYALEAIRRAGLEPLCRAVRGGTDGSRFTERGLPTPNLFAGYYDIHSPREWASLQDMAKAVETVVHLVRIWEERA